MEKLRHQAIQVPLIAAAPEAAAMGEDQDPNVSLLQRASKLISSTVTAYRGKPPSFWALLALSAGAMLTAFPASSLLSRVYYDGGGQSKWILSWSAVAGWPIPALLLPPCYLLLEGASPTWPPPPGLCLWYALLGLLSAADNLMFAWAYAYLPAVKSLGTSRCRSNAGYHYVCKRILVLLLVLLLVLWVYVSDPSTTANQDLGGNDADSRSSSPRSKAQPRIERKAPARYTGADWTT